MKKLSNATIIAVVSALLIAISAFALVGNGTFETGDFTSWTKTTFINNGFSAAAGAGGSDLSVIVGGPAVTALSLSDPHTSDNVLYPAYGHYSARINSDAAYTGGGFGQNANRISQNISAVLDSTDSLAHIRFTYAAVMVNPVSNPHTAEEKPYFRVRAINTSNGNDVLYDFSSYVGEPGKNWQNGPVFSGSDFWQYLDWNYIDLASSAAHPVNAGDTITLEITAAGCSLGGHPGYVYVDEITDGAMGGPTINATGPSTIVTGATITYTYTYINNSGSSIDPKITVNQPSGVNFTSVSDTANCSLSSGTVTCNYTGIGAGTGGSFTIDGTVTALGGTQIAHGDYNIGATGFPTLGGQTVLTDVLANTTPTITEGLNVSVTMDEDGAPTPFALTLHATDPDNDTLTWSVSTGANYGLAGINSNTAVVSYKPSRNYWGPDSFIVSVSDGKGGTATITVNVTVNPINDPLLEENSYFNVYNNWQRKREGSAFKKINIVSKNGRIVMNIPAGATEFRLFTKKGPNQGIVRIDVDGQLARTVDLYNSTAVWNVPVPIALSGTDKKVTIIATGTKNSASTNTWIGIDATQFTPGFKKNDDLRLAKWPFVRNSSATAGIVRRSMSKGRVTMTFRGQSVAWNTYRGPNAGIAEVYIDGSLFQTVDLYNPTDEWGYQVSSALMPYGKHTIEVRVTGTKNAMSSGYWVVLDSFDKE